MSPVRSLAPLAVTLGDPAGVGPEIVVKAWSALRTTGPDFFAVGDPDTLATAFPAGAVKIERIDDPAQAHAVFRRALPVFEPSRLRQSLGATTSTARAQAVILWIETAVEFALAGQASGVVTAPIAKAPLYEAGFQFPGHTEFLAELTAQAPLEGRRGPVMMLAVDGLRVVLVTIHTPLAKVAGAVTREAVAQTAPVTHEALRPQFGLAAPRLAMGRRHSPASRATHRRPE